MKELNLQVGDYFTLRGEATLYRVVCFSNLRGVRVPSWVITYSEKDGCAWTRPVVQLVHTGYEKKPTPDDADEWRIL